MKRKYSRLIFRAEYADETGIYVGYIYNKASGNPEDVIFVYIVSKGGRVTHFHCRLDEATALAAGLNKVASQMLVGQLPIPIDTMKFLEDAQCPQQT